MLEQSLSQTIRRKNDRKAYHLREVEYPLMYKSGNNGEKWEHSIRRKFKATRGIDWRSNLIGQSNDHSQEVQPQPSNNIRPSEKSQKLTLSCQKESIIKYYFLLWEKVSEKSST